ncbi:hypothetical protein D910_08240 [Dendroctonus ponderosae]|uniref:Uncharacterized protein n=1 Tax=Dendroctonus ponderosae TaxID=77166 RepID=U4ULM2_DENPD|nr:hypothetical protein D910_08240 [Dendroctonus ponderosae]KAH1006306.1 hypothetical protein HUJ05_007053 [Dendroctonus ponderosae]
MADDLLQGLKDAVDNLDQGEEPGAEDPQDRIKQLLKALKDLPGISDEQKENLAKSVLGGEPGSQLPLGSPIANPWLEFAVLFGLISFVILLLGFIGYRLYQNMIDQDRRKELKRLKKEQRKRK